MSSPPPKRKRVRSESQLNQKRLADRLKHRENRQENKQRLEKIENDISDIKSALQSLAHQFQAQPGALAPPGLPHTHPHRQEPTLQPFPLLGQQIPFDSPALDSAALLSAPQLGPGGQGSEQGQQSWWPMAHSPHTEMMWRQVESRFINCQCGHVHADQFDCIDRCTVTSFYQHQVAFPGMHEPSGLTPRNPSLPSMLLHNMDENVATFLITGFLRQYKNKGIEQLLSFYLLGYRYMRVSGGDNSHSYFVWFGCQYEQLLCCLLY